MFARGVRALLDRRRRHTRDGSPSCSKRREVADHEHLRVAGHASGPGSTRTRPARSSGDAERARRAATPRRRRPRPSCAPRAARRRPRRRAASMPVTAEPVQHLTPSRLELPPAPCATAPPGRRQHARARLDQHHARLRAGRCGGSRAPASGARSRRRRRPSRPRSARRRSPRTSATAAGALGVVLALGLLEGEEHAPADLERVLDRLEPRRVRRPVVVAEVRVASRRPPGSGSRSRARRRRAARASPPDRSPSTSPSSTLHVRLAAQDAADRRGDLGRRQPRGGHLVEQRLEHVVVLAVDERHVDRRARQGLGRRRGRRSRRR